MDNNCYMLVMCHMSDVQMAGTGAHFSLHEGLRISLHVLDNLISQNSLSYFCGFTHFWKFLVHTWASSWQSHHFCFLGVILSYDSNLLIPKTCFATLQAQLNLHHLIQFCRSVSRYNKMFSKKSVVHHIIICTYGIKIADIQGWKYLYNILN